MKYLKDILDIIKTYNLLFLAIIVFLLQIISYFFKKYSVDIYGPSSFLTIYVLINLPFSVYQLIIGGIIATFFSYIIYKLLPKINKTINNILTFTIIITFMVLFNCVSMPAVAYTLMAPISIPNNPTSYLTSYIFSTIIIFILCYSVLFILKKTLQDPFKIELFNLKQLEKNITNFSF